MTFTCHCLSVLFFCRMSQRLAMTLQPQVGGEAMPQGISDCAAMQTSAPLARCAESDACSLCCISHHVTALPSPQLHPLSSTDIVFDGGASRDGSGRPLTKLVWQQVASSDVVLSAAIDKANNENSGNGGPRLIIPGTVLSKMDSSSSYTISLAATNFLGQTASQSITFTKRASGETPVVAVLGGSPQSFQIAQGISLSAQLQAASVCPNKQVSLTHGSACARIACDCLYLHPWQFAHALTKPRVCSSHFCSCRLSGSGSLIGVGLLPCSPAVTHAKTLSFLDLSWACRLALQSSST